MIKRDLNGYNVLDFGRNNYDSGHIDGLFKKAKEFSNNGKPVIITNVYVNGRRVSGIGSSLVYVSPSVFTQEQLRVTVLESTVQRELIIYSDDTYESVQLDWKNNIYQYEALNFTYSLSCPLPATDDEELLVTWTAQDGSGEYGDVVGEIFFDQYHETSKIWTPQPSLKDGSKYTYGLYVKPIQIIAGDPPFNAKYLMGTSVSTISALNHLPINTIVGTEDYCLYLKLVGEFDGETNKADYKLYAKKTPW